MNPEDIKILLVDDEPDILEIISYSLKNAGYNIFTATNGIEAVEQTAKINPHLIILDVMMPEMDGIEACEIIRKNSKNQHTLITFLSARGEDYSQIAGFDAGADDYILKPIKPKVLMSRVKALINRVHKNIDPTSHKLDHITVGDIEIDLKKYIVSFEGVEINLPKKEFQLLVLLSSKPGVVHTREQIMDKIWGSEVIVGDRTIDVHIRKLREKFGEGIINTIRGVGYKITA